MKDKRQRLAMAWPCDPAVYAYLLNAATAAAAAASSSTSSYPYLPAAPAPPPPHVAALPPAPLGYYSAGLQRVAAAAAGHHPHAVDLPLPRTGDHPRRAPPVSEIRARFSESLAGASDDSPKRRSPLVSSATPKTATLFQPYKSDIERA